MEEVQKKKQELAEKENAKAAEKDEVEMREDQRQSPAGLAAHSRGVGGMVSVERACSTALFVVLL